MLKQDTPQNPFIIEGYLSPLYFCDRKQETALLSRHLTNGCNVALIAPRRMGKTGLIFNCFNQPEIHNTYHCIYIDIYETKNLDEFVYELGKGILTELRSKERKVWETFLNALHSLKSTISFDINGYPEWSMAIGDHPARGDARRDIQLLGPCRQALPGSHRRVSDHSELSGKERGSRTAKTNTALPQCPFCLFRLQAPHGSADVHLAITPLLQQRSHHGSGPD